jgi:hypothetical protein
VAEHTGWKSRKSHQSDGSPNRKTSWNSLACCAALREHAPFGEDTWVCCRTDNTNAKGWLHKTNFYDDKEKIELARWLAEHQIKQKYCLYSQWFAGKANIVSDALSRDHHLSGHELTSRLLSQHPKQLPKTFRIYPVSQKTRSWVYSMLPTRHENMEPPSTPTRSPLGASAAGSNSPTASTSVPILTWRTLTKQPESECSEPSANQSGDYTRGRDANHPLLGSTAKEHVKQVAAAFMAAGRPDPQLGRFGNHSKLLQRQYKGYENIDRPIKHEKALTAAIFVRMWELAESPKEKHLVRLAIGAFYHAMRSCEYLKVQGERCTKVLCSRNLCFFRGLRELSHNDPGLPFADAIFITFNYQKTDVRDATITMYPTDQALLCPVRAWAAIVGAIKNLPGSTENTPVCLLFTPATNPTPDNPGKFAQMTGKDMTSLIRKAVADIGSERLGFTPEECGTHSIRSAAAMAMHMAGVPVYTIMLIGRWSSDAFLIYLQPQVMQFTQHVSKRMTKHSEFYNVPCFDPAAGPNDKHQTTRSHPFTTVPALSNGGGSNRLVPRNPFHLFG